MTTSIPRILLALVAGGCSPLDGSGVSSQDQRAAVIDTYDRWFEWSSPVACRVYLDTRVLDEDAHLVEYTAQLADDDLAVVYSIEPDASHPLQAAVYDAAGYRMLATRADEHELVVEDGHGAVVMRVFGYDAETAAETTVDGTGSLDAAATGALACVLPARTELGSVPRFLLNLASGGRLADAPEVSQSSSDSPELLSWSGELTILSSFIKQGLCLGPSGWRCPCVELHDDILDVKGWCP